MRPFFSIIIPALNEEKFLPLLLKDISSQTFPRDRLEVIVVDGHSDDQTVQKAEEFTSVLPLRIFKDKVRHVSHQRNLGISKAKGVWSLFMDADTRIPKFFLDGLKFQIARHPHVDALTTWVAIEKKSAVIKAIEQAINWGLELYLILGREAALGAFMACRTKLAKTHPFDETTTVCEDVYFIQKLVEENYSFEIYKEPRYFFSSRRIEREGPLKIVGIAARIQLGLLLGKDFKTDHMGYVMNGGGYYTKSATSPSFPLTNIQKFLKSASADQIAQVRKTFKRLQALTQELYQ